MRCIPASTAKDGDDLRNLPLSMRETNLARLLPRRPEGIFISEFEQARSGQTCIAKPANSDLKVQSASTETDHPAAIVRSTGSR